MEKILSSSLDIILQPPGDLFFHLVVILSLLLMTVIALVNFKKNQKNNRAKHTLLGCGILLFIQIFLLALRPFNQGVGFNSGYAFPLFERLVATLTIAWLVWLFFDDQSGIPTSLNLYLSLMLIIFAVITMLVTPSLAQLPSLSLNLINQLWQLIALILIIIGVILVLISRPTHRWAMVAILLVLAVGHTIQMLMQNNLQWNMGVVRLAQALSLPWVLTMMPQFSQDNEEHELLRKSKSETGNAEMLIDTKPTLVKLLLEINLTDTIEEKYQGMARALSHSVISDICYLVRVSNVGEKIYIMAGYDLIQEIFLKPDRVAREDLPGIMAAWEENQVFRLSTDSAKSKDAATLAMRLNYHGIGNLFAYPLLLPDKSLTGGILFLSPYTGKSWGNKTKQYLDEISNILVQILFAPNAEEQTKLTLNQLKLQISALIKEQDHLRQALSDKEAQIQEKETAIKELKVKYQIEKMETATNIEKMKARIAELTTQLSSTRFASTEVEQMKSELRHLRSEREQLSIALNRANAAIKDLQTQTGQTGPIRLSLDNQMISLDSIAANIRLQVASQLKLKDIDFEIHNPDGRLMIKTDPELLQTALYELINNGIKASSPGGTIRLDQKLSLEMGVLIVQVTDFGDGLSQVEQTALFSGQHDTIPGIGEVQAIRKAIRAIRVLNGKIWLKSKKASYTTFRTQIPVRIID